MSDDLDFDALEKQYAKRGAKPVDDLDFDVLEKAHEAQQAAQTQSVPLTPDRQKLLDERISSTSLPVRGTLGTIADAFRESNAAVGQQLADKTLFGLPGAAMRAAGATVNPVQPIPDPGKGDAHRPEDYAPTENTLSSVPAAALDMASIGGAFGKAGQAIGQAPAGIARALGAREAQLAVRPGLQAAADAGGAGALYSGADTAMHGGTPGEVLESMPQGALANMAMSQIPAVAEGVEGALSKRVVANDLRPIKQMSKKGTLDKELIQFGNGDPELGAREMVDFVRRENLGPILRQKGSAAINQYEAAKDKVWETDLKPIYDHAKAAEPDASVPFDEIASKLRANIRKTGGNEHRLVEKAIDEIKARTELVSQTGDIPLATVLTNARDFQSAGHAGVVNYDAPPESKVVMRQVGRVLRGIANERVADIYSRHPEAAHALFTEEAPKRMGVTFRDQPSTPEMMRSEQYPNAWARRYENFQEYAADVPRLLAEGNKRFSDYAKLEPLVRQASTLKAGEKKWGLMNLLGHGMTGTAAGLGGYFLAGVPGAVGATAAAEGARMAYPYALRGANGLAGAFAGPAVQSYSRNPMTGEVGGSQIAGALTLKPLQDDKR